MANWEITRSVSQWIAAATVLSRSEHEDWTVRIIDGLEVDIEEHSCSSLSVEKALLNIGRRNRGPDVVLLALGHQSRKLQLE